MKKTLLLTAVLFCTLAEKGQDYRPLEEFGADTIAYLRYNFIDRKDQYIGYRFDKIVQDYEMQPFRMNPTRTYMGAPGANGRSYVDGAVFVYPHNPNDEEYRKTGRSYGMLKVTFSPPLPDYKEIWSSISDLDDDRAWATRIGNLLVKDIELWIEPSGETIK